jgi:hypothetical protein
VYDPEVALESEPDVLLVRVPSLEQVQDALFAVDLHGVHRKTAVQDEDQRGALPASADRPAGEPGRVSARRQLLHQPLARRFPAFRRHTRGHGIEDPPPVDLAGVPEALAVRQSLFDQRPHGRGPVEVETSAVYAADATFVSSPTTAAHHAIGTRVEDDADHARSALPCYHENLLT